MAEEEAQKSKSGKTKRQIITFDVVRLAALSIIIVGGIVWASFKVHNNNSLPEKLTNEASFAVYYPAAIPEGYKLDKNSAQFDKNVLFFSFSNMDKKVSVSEQAAPKVPPDFSAIQKIYTGFKKIDIPIGQAILGLEPANKVPVAIIETNTTLINMSGTKDTPSDIINKLAQSLASLPQ